MARPARPATRARPPDDESEVDALGRWRQQEGESSDDDGGLPTSLRVGKPPSSKRKAARERRRAAARAKAEAAAGGDGSGAAGGEEEAEWRATLAQVARAEEDSRARTKEAAALAHALLSAAAAAVPLPPPPEALPERAEAAGAGSGGAGFAFGLRLRRGADAQSSRVSADNAADNAKRRRLSVAAEGASGEALLPNWLAARDELGGGYYFNSATGESCHEPPLRWPPTIAAERELGSV